MPDKPTWAQAVRSKYSKIIPTLGSADASIVDDTGLDLSKAPLAGTVRRELPDLSIAPVSGNKTFSGVTVAKPGRVARTARKRSFGVEKAPLGAKGSLVQAGQVTLQTLADVLERTDPSSVIGTVKGTIKETAKSTVRLAGAGGEQIYRLSTDPLFRKAATGQKLTPAEWKEFNERIAPEYERNLQLAGFNTRQTPEESAKQTAADVFNVGTAIATAAPVVRTVGKTGKVLYQGGKPLLSSLSTKTVSALTKQAIKEGTPLAIDVSGNVFAQQTTKEVVKSILKSGAKNTLKFADDVFKPVFTKIYTQGMVTELTNEARKLIDKEGAARIERDRRKFIEEDLSTPERLFLDLVVGYWLPFEVPALKTTYRTLDEAKDTVSLANASHAFDKAFADEKSLQILDRLSEFNDVKWNNPLDIQLKGDLLRHMMTNLDEDGTARTVEHFSERLKLWANSPEVDYMIRRRKVEGTATNLSWYSNKLGRALEPHEQLMHWFITETRGDYIGDLGDELEAAFEEALRLRTTGLPERLEKVSRAIKRQQDIKLLAGGKIINAGDAATVRTSIDTMLVNRASILKELKSTLQDYGSDFIVKGEKLIVPEQFVEVPKIRKLLDANKEIGEDLAVLVNNARGFGVPNEILSIPSNKKLLEFDEAYDVFRDFNSSFGAVDSSLKKDMEFIYNQVLDSGADIRSQVLVEEKGKVYQKFEDVYNNLIKGGAVRADATKDEVFDFIVSFPYEKGVPKLTKGVLKTLNKAEQEALRLGETISNFDRYLVANLNQTGKLPTTEVTEIIDEVRKIEAQLPRGAFAPEFLVQTNRWGSGVTPIPLQTEPISIPQWAEAVAKLQDANGVTRAITNYLVPHNPADIYVKAMNKLESAIAAQNPDVVDKVLRDVAKVQDEGISLLPVLPGGGPKWDALGKPMITGVQWKTLDNIGKAYGIENLGQISREAFVNSISESGVKPFIVDQLRASPTVGSFFDAIYRQYMLARFAINPAFHAQQVPEAALFGTLRSFNLPTEMSEKYLKSVIRNPFADLTSEEQVLYDLLNDADFFAKTAKKGKGVDNLAGLTQETLLNPDVLKSTTLEERKRFAGFMAEFPVQVRGQLFDFPALKNTDPLAMEEYRDFILGLQNNPSKMVEVLQDAFSVNDFDLKREAVRRAVKSTNVEVSKLVSYNLNRSALEKDLHAIFFPFSFGKKTWSEITSTVTGGSVARPVIAGNIFEGLNELQENPTMMEVRAKYPTMVGWTWSLLPVNPQYDLVNLSQGSIGFGGLRAPPTQALLFDTFVDPEGKYNFIDNPDSSIRKLGGGGAAFWARDLPALYSEIFRADTPEEQRRYIYWLRRYQLEAQIKSEPKD